MNSLNNVALYPHNSFDTRRKSSEEITGVGAAGTVAFGAVHKSTKIANSFVKLIRESKIIKDTNKSKILKIFEKSKFMTKFPIIKRIAGPLAGFAALTTVVGSVAKVADTCSYMNGINAQG